jgi:NADH-quinone oxidoreductase subunit G
MSEKTAIVVEEKLVSLVIDEQEVSVPAGTLLVDAAKMIGVDIPVFCYHPKMEPVGMCRMCLVEVGRPARDRATGEAILNEDGTPRIDFGPKLETGCTVPVSEGMVVRGYTEEVTQARDEVLEFLLTSHPLDCPICDKGGECPLQNLTMNFGPGQTRYLYDEKIHLDKHVPLGDLMFLDRERCIQCARCTRFQDEVVADPVIGFSQRGRALEIVTFSEPGFDSYWSGNTSDICPVGALTTADFRFGARPWEMKASASVCNHCAVGCNTTLNTRREAKSGGHEVVKRIMPRQNEEVNEIWLCDKGRFGYHYTEPQHRISQPLIRRKDKLEPATWDEAISLVAEKFKKAASKQLTLAGGRLSNEDFFNISQLSTKLGGRAVLDSNMMGGDMVAQLGLGQGSSLSDLGKGDTVLVIASDLEEEAPIWWLRLKQAAERGANLIVANPRRTKLDQSAIRVLRYAYGEEAALIHAMLDSVSPKRPDQPASVKKLLRDDDVKAAAKEIAEAENLVVFYGSEGTGLLGSQSLAAACSNLLIATGHIGKAQNGLVAVWDKGNAQAAWDNGLQPSANLAEDMAAASALYIVAADPLGDDPTFADSLEASEFVVVQTLNMSATAAMADVVLPAQAFTEREGSYTSGERRVQRFYPAVPPIQGTQADFTITAQIAAKLGLELEAKIAGSAFLQMAAKLDAYKEVDYKKLAEVHDQWPIIGRDDVYYGGTTYDNSQGLGVQLTSGAERGESPALTFDPPAELAIEGESLLAVPITVLYDRGTSLEASAVLGPRLQNPQVRLSPKDAEKLGLEMGSTASLKIAGTTTSLLAYIDNSIPTGTVLVPRSLGVAINQPSAVELKAGA